MCVPYSAQFGQLSRQRQRSAFLIFWIYQCCHKESFAAVLLVKLSCFISRGEGLVNTSIPLQRWALCTYTGNHQHGFTKGESCLTNLIACYDKITRYKGEGRGSVIFLNGSKALDIVPTIFFCQDIAVWVGRQLVCRNWMVGLRRQWSMGCTLPGDLQ